MTDPKDRRRENDALQSGEGNLAYGQEPQDFGAGGQTTTAPLTSDDEPHRDPERDPTLEPAHENPSSTKKWVPGTYEDRQASKGKES